MIKNNLINNDIQSMGFGQLASVRFRSGDLWCEMALQTNLSIGNSVYSPVSPDHISLVSFRR